MTDLLWHRVADLDELPEGRVKTVAAGHHSIALTHHDGRYGALSNRCPHQGGPLGEGTIEKGMLRCPWHGYDYCPLTGGSDFGDGVPAYALEIREDGVYVGVEPDDPHTRTVTDAMVETMVAWASGTCSAWSATRTSASPTPCAARRRPATSPTS